MPGCKYQILTDDSKSNIKFFLTYDPVYAIMKENEDGGTAMNLEGINTNEQSVPTVISARRSKLEPGKYDFLTGKEYQVYLNWNPTGESLYEDTDGKYFRISSTRGELLILPPFTHHFDIISENDFDYDGYLLLSYISGFCPDRSPRDHKAKLKILYHH